MQGPALHHKAVIQGKDAVALDFGHDVFAGEGREEAIQVVRVVECAGCLAHRAEEVRAVLRLREAVHIVVGGAELAVAGRYRVHDVDADEVARQSVQPRVDQALLLDARLGAALAHELVHIRNGDDDEARVVLHAGDLHLHAERPAVLDPAVGQLKHLVFIQRLRQEFPVHGRDKGFLLVGMDVELRVPLAALEEVRAAPRLGERAEAVVGVILDERIGIHIDVV